MEFSVPYCKTNTRWSPSSCKSDQTQRPNDTVATTARPGAARSFVPGQSGRVDGRSSGASMGGEKVQTEHGVTARVSSGAGSALASSAVTGAKAGLPGASKPADVEIDDFILSGIMDLGGSRGDGRGNEANEMGAGASGAGRYGHQSTGQTEERDQLVENMRRSSKKFGSLAGGTEIEDFGDDQNNEDDMEAIKDDSDADDVGFSSFNASKMGDKWKKDRPAGGARAHRVTGMDKRSGASEQEAAAIRTDDDDF